MSGGVVVILYGAQPAARSPDADEFLVKPLHFGELETRVNSALRGAYPTRVAAARLMIPPYAIDLLKREIALDGKPVALQTREYALAVLLFRQPNVIVTRETIVATIWQGQSLENSRTVDTHISRIRAKLDFGAARGVTLHSIYCVGYRLQINF